MKKSMCFFSILALCSMSFAADVPAQPAEKAPLVNNATFDKMAGANLAGWICVVPAKGLTVTGEPGKRVLKLTKSGEDACMAVQRNLPMAFNKSYAVSCEVRSTDQGSGMVYVEYRVKQADGTYKHTSVHATRLNGTEQWTEVLFEVGPRSEECEPPYIVLMSASNSMEFRNLKVMEVE